PAVSTAPPPASAEAAPPAAERPKRPPIADVEAEGEDESDILLLTEEAEDEVPLSPVRESPLALEEDEPPPAPPRRQPEPLSFDPEPDFEPAAAPEEANSLVDRLISERAAAASLAAMSELVSRSHREPNIESLPMGNANQTLEDL